MNFRIFINKIVNIIFAEDGYEWGEVYDNYTGNGVLGSVVEREAEVAVGSIYQW